MQLFVYTIEAIVYRSCCICLILILAAVSIGVTLQLVPDIYNLMSCVAIVYFWPSDLIDVATSEFDVAFAA